MTAPLYMALAVLAVAAGSAMALRVDDASLDLKERPVTKVVNLLKDMQAQLEKEAAEDEDLYDKLVCWCETNEKDKTKAIEIENKMITELTATIEETAAKHSQLTTEVANLKKELASNTAALEEAGALRSKESAEFSSDEKDTLATIDSLKGAVDAIGRQHGGSALLQRQSLTKVTSVLRRQLKAKPGFLTEMVSPHQRRELMAALQHPDGMVSLLQQAPSAGSYAPQSGAIFGILKQMKEEFETNLESSRKDEASAASSFSELKAAKNEEIKAAGDKAFNKEAEAADALQKNAEAKEDLTNTQTALEADTGFLEDLKKTCAVTDEDWEARSKMRQDEIAAVSDTIAMLTSDDARDLFSSSLGLIQLQARAQREAGQRAKAVTFLAEAGKKLNSPRVSYLAERMRFDPFGKLRESIDGMAGTLVKEGEDEIHQKDGCVSDFKTNDDQTTERRGHKADVETEIADLESEISALDEEEKMLLAQIADAQLEMKKAGENREQENKEFQAVIADQRATQAILKKAIERLEQFYGPSMVQQPKLGEAPPAMPGGFKPYKKAGGSGPIYMIKGIVMDSERVEKNGIAAEQDAQTAYEEFIKDTNTGIKAKQASLVADEETEAKDRIQESNDETDKKGTIEDILNLGDLKGALHKECDFTLNNFEARQEARTGEVEALKQAKAIFSGMK